MPQFSPGEQKTAVASMSNPTVKAFDYRAELYMGTNLAVMSQVDFHLEAGEEKDISLPVTMPSVVGTYPVYIGAFSGGVNIALYKVSEDVTIVPAPEVYYCSYCGATFSTQEELNTHISAEHPGQSQVTFTCPVCEAAFSSYTELLAHIQSQHPEQLPVFICPVCGKQFSTQEELDAHIAEHQVPPDSMMKITSIKIWSEDGYPHVHSGEEYFIDLTVEVPHLIDMQVGGITLTPDISSAEPYLLKDYGNYTKITDAKADSATAAFDGWGTKTFTLNARASWESRRYDGPIPKGVYPVKAKADLWCGRKYSKTGYYLYGYEPIARWDFGVVAELVVRHRIEVL